MDQKIQQFLPKPFKRRRYYLPSQVQAHNQANNCWIVLFQQVFDITRLLQTNIQKAQVQPLIKRAGKCVTHWFDSKTQQPRQRIDTKSGQRTYYAPEGQFIHLKRDEFTVPWWKDQQLMIGHLTSRVRTIRLYNMLIDDSIFLQVPQEQTINQILDRYSVINKHAASYKWKRLGRPLDMAKTLKENDIHDDTVQFEKFEVPQAEWYYPTIHLYFQDDLTIA